MMRPGMPKAAVFASRFGAVGSSRRSRALRRLSVRTDWQPRCPADPPSFSKVPSNEELKLTALALDAAGSLRSPAALLMVRRSLYRHEL